MIENKKVEKMKQKLENIIGDFITAFNQLMPESILHAFEIQKERYTNYETRERGLWTADFPMYAIEKGEAVLYLAPIRHNLIFQNIDEAVKQITKTGMYRPTDEGIKQVVDSVKTGETLKVNLSDMNLKECVYDKRWSYFEFSTLKEEYIMNLNPIQRLLAEKIHGSGEDFDESMKMIREEGKSSTKIYVLNHEYVKKHAKDKAIACLSYIYGTNAIFGAVCNYIGEYGGWSMRGVPKSIESTSLFIDKKI